MRMGERCGAFRVLVGKREENRHLGRPGRGWEDYMETGVTGTFGRCKLVWSGSSCRLV